jgi:signal transduction histidine kinase
MTQLVQDVVDMVLQIGEYRGKNVICESTGPVIAEVNPQEIKQVVLNLVANSLDSVDDGGRVVLQLTSDGEQSFQLSVRDDGCGMAPEVVEHLFEPFFTRRRDGQGTGLGLSITYRIVQDHGGEITASSPGPGRGAEFIVELPLVVKNDEEKQKARAA